MTYEDSISEIEQSHSFSFALTKKDMDGGYIYSGYFIIRDFAPIVATLKKTELSIKKAVHVL